MDISNAEQRALEIEDKIEFGNVGCNNCGGKIKLEDNYTAKDDNVICFVCSMTEYQQDSYGYCQEMDVRELIEHVEHIQDLLFEKQSLADKKRNEDFWKEVKANTEKVRLASFQKYYGNKE